MTRPLPLDGIDMPVPQPLCCEEPMIFGRIDAERRDITRSRWWFAWHPVLLYDFRWAWLQRVWCVYTRTGTGDLGCLPYEWVYHEKEPSR